MPWVTTRVCLLTKTLTMDDPRRTVSSLAT